MTCRINQIGEALGYKDHNLKDKIDLYKRYNDIITAGFELGRESENTEPPRKRKWTAERGTIVAVEGQHPNVNNRSITPGKETPIAALQTTESQVDFANQIGDVDIVNGHVLLSCNSAEQVLSGVELQGKEPQTLI